MKRWTDLPARAVLVASLAACSAPPAPVVVAASAPSASASPVEPPPSVRARPTASKSGWFTVPTPSNVRAVSLEDGRCVAFGSGARWIVTPFKTRSPTGSICDGDAKPLGDLPGDFFPVARYGRGVLYGSFGAGIATSDTPEGDLRIVKVPFAMDYRSPTLAGTGILALGATDKKLHLLDGETWKDVALDGSDVASVAGTREGYGFAVTSSNRLYMTEDNGKTWKVHATTGFSKLTYLGVGTDPSVPHPTHGQLSLWGTASAPVGDRKAGDAVGAVLLGSVPVDVFFDVALRFEQPDGVSDPSGVNLAKRAAARESLGDGRTCDAFDILGDAAVASCTDDKGRFFVFTDDAGATVVEIDRGAAASKPRVLRLGADQLFVAPSCPSGGADCDDSTPFVLEKGADGVWSRTAVELPKGSRVDTAIDARRGRGFYLVDVRTELAAEKEGGARQLLEVARTGGPSKRIVRRSLNGVDAPHMFESKIREVRAVDVDDDGTLVLVVRLEDRTSGYLRLSERLEPIAVQLCTSPLLDAASSVAVRGKQVVGVVDLLRVALSTDGCTSFSSYQARDDAPFGVDAVTCGTEGCDFATGAETSLWRWGDKPIDTVIGRKLPH